MAWKISGQYMESCNCDYLCPCIYTNPQGRATHDHCTALMAFRIDEGQADGVDLAGCKFAFLIKTGPVMADGNWTFANAVDAPEGAPRTTLAKIVAGEAGGIPQRIRDGLVADYRGIAYKPIEFGIDGLKRWVNIPEVLSFAIEGVQPRIKPGEPMYIDNTSHPANARLALARASKMTALGFGIGDSLVGKGNNGHFAPFSWAG
ncbi:DUF1326 domain-containing protein [Desertibaculum subflavum]|uniref:DUF1326 domain-containing protein n=1 Tax=Desertibaculum subflavum TaxID=2268458 RepID=UPI0013C4106C